MQISDTEYMERLIYLMPKTITQTTERVYLDNNAVIHSAIMIEDISEIIINHLTQFKETDQILELKDAMMNIAVLGRFLAILLKKILVEQDEED